MKLPEIKIECPECKKLIQINTANLSTNYDLDLVECKWGCGEYFVIETRVTVSEFAKFTIEYTK